MNFNKTLSTAALCGLLAVPAAVSAQSATEPVAAPQTAQTPAGAMPGMMKGGHKHHGGGAGKSGQGKGGHGKGGHGKGGHGGGHGGMKEKHRQVVNRLDLIEVRMAKIEAMLEILLKR